MNARFELIRDDSDRIRFRLMDSNGDELLLGHPTGGKIAAQNEVLHARKSILADRFLIQDDSGSHFVVLQDHDGSDLAKSPKVDSAKALEELVATIRECGAAGALIDQTKKRISRTAG